MFRMMNKLKNRKGFTLIELIVVLAVLAIIMAIAVPRFIGVQESARVDADYSSGSLIAKTAEFYSVKGVSDANLLTEVKKDFPQGIVFQSKNIKAQTLNDAKISTSGTGIIVEITKGSSDYQIYPKTGGGL